MGRFAQVLTSMAAGLAALLPAARADDYACGDFAIRFDLTALDALMPIMRGEGGEAAIDAALELASVTAIVRKQAQYTDRSTPEQLRIELLAAQAGEPVEDGVYPMPDAEVLAAMDAALARMRADPDALMAPACQRLASYLPAGYDTDLNTAFVLGVHAAGFTFGDSLLYIGFHRMHADWEGLELVLVHELYHGAQGSYAPISAAQLALMPETTRRALDYLGSGYLEGSATWVGDPRAWEGDGEMLDFFQTRLERGINERGNLFTLFEASLYQLANDPTTDPRRHYFAGFTGDERNYNVGYIIAREIEAAYGRETLAGLMTRPATDFYRLYSQIEDPSGPRLSDSFMAIVDEVDAALVSAAAD